MPLGGTTTWVVQLSIVALPSMRSGPSSPLMVQVGAVEDDLGGPRRVHAVLPPCDGQPGRRQAATGPPLGQDAVFRGRKLRAPVVVRLASAFPARLNTPLTIGQAEIPVAQVQRNAALAFRP